MQLQKHISTLAIATIFSVVTITSHVSIEANDIDEK